MKKFEPLSKDFPHFLIGGDYNPEQWLDYPQILEDDMTLMKEAHCNEMTMGIFSWDTLEPEEGVFTFDWLDERMDAVYRNGGRVILATPSAACPRWLQEKHPEIGVLIPSGQQTQFCRRQNRCLNAPYFREKVRIINEKLAERYASHPALIGWHLSNEYRGLDCQCPQCVESFRNYLRTKYQNDIRKLNHEWWTAFWSRRYTSFDQIMPPNPVYGESADTGLTLEWRRFISDSVINFIGMECDSLRKYSNAPITTNCMGFFERFDHYKMAKHLDFCSNDSYPGWAGGINDENISLVAATSSLYRSLKGGRPYILMESAPGINIYRQNFGLQKSTELQIFESMLHVATGADSVLYFQWRKGRGGAEKYHGAIVDHYGKSDNRVFQSVKQIGAMLQKMDGIVGTSIRAEVGIVRDYETIWALNGDPTFTLFHKDPNNYDALVKDTFRACWDANIAADIIGYDTDFGKYKVLILPSPYLMTESNAQKLKDFTANGGTLISYCMAAMANENDLTYIGGAPACGLQELFGLRVDEFTQYGGKDCIYSNEVSFCGRRYPLKRLAEVLIPHTAAPVAEFTRDFFAGSPAATKTAYGSGTAYYIAFQPELSFIRDFLAQVLPQADVCGITAIKGDEAIRVTCREGDGEKYYFVLNGSETPQSFTIQPGNSPLIDLLDGAASEDTVTLPPLGVKVLKA